jgi:hypothetical protein
MNRIALLVAGCAALTLAACDHPDAARQRAARAMKVISKLDCPATQGHLTLSTASADGLTCDYAADGVEVTLKLVRLENGNAVAALSPIEAGLRTLMPSVKPGAAVPAAGDATKGDQDVDISLPGISIRTAGDSANVSVGGANGPNIRANDDGAEIRVQRNVERDGTKVESEGRRGHHDDGGVYARFILASDKATQGWAVVGYEARGPQGGPLVVATLKAKRGQHNDDDSFSDVDALVRHNVGGRRNANIAIGSD